MIYKYELGQLLTKMRKEYDFVSKQIEGLPEGRLMITRRGERKEFFHEYYINHKRNRKSIGSDEQMIGRLARKEYLKVKRSMLTRNIRLLEAAEKEFADISHDEICRLLPSRVKQLPEKLLFEYDPRESSCHRSNYLPEGRIHTTSRGLKVRSKSELIIAEKLYEHDVSFRYEELLHVGKHTFVPDFTISRWDGKLFYWEHCGRTHDKQYMDHHRWKINLYEGIGIVPWDNLIVTYDNEEGSINLAAVEGEIKAKLLV